MSTYTFEQVLELYIEEQGYYNLTDPFDVYLKEHFVQTFDLQFNFIGYERIH